MLYKELQKDKETYYVRNKKIAQLSLYQWQKVLRNFRDVMLYKVTILHLNKSDFLKKYPRRMLKIAFQSLSLQTPLDAGALGADNNNCPPSPDSLLSGLMASTVSVFLLACGFNWSLEFCQWFLLFLDFCQWFE